MTPAELLPGRYIINYGVPNPLTCRHKHACLCHGEPPAKKADARPNEKAYIKKKQDLEHEFLGICGRLSLALRSYPEASDALDRLIAEFRERYPDGSP